jgi:hypothetical protein
MDEPKWPAATVVTKAELLEVIGRMEDWERWKAAEQEREYTEKMREWEDTIGERLLGLIPALREYRLTVETDSFLHRGELLINSQDFLPPRHYSRTDHTKWLAEQRAGVEALPDGVVPWALRRLLRMYSADR